MELTQRMKPVVGAGSAVRVLRGNHMGIHLDRLPVEESARLQEFLLPMIPSNKIAALPKGANWRLIKV